MPPATNPARTRERIQAQLNAIGKLRGGGPNPLDYNQWYDRTLEVLAAIYGEDSDAVARLREAAGLPGRLPGVRGQAGNMTLNIHGPWGIRARLDRAEAVLKDLAAGL
jgi:hypothetical protein